MASALRSLANATATFEVAGDGVVTDPETGNVLPASESVSVTLFLKSDRVRSSTFPGVEIQEIVFDGYAVSKLDERVAVGTNGTLSFSGQEPIPCEVTGVRLPYGNTGLLGGTLSTVLGERIQLVSSGQVT